MKLRPRESVTRQQFVISFKWRFTCTLNEKGTNKVSDHTHKNMRKLKKILHSYEKQYERIKPCVHSSISSEQSSPLYPVAQEQVKDPLMGLVSQIAPSWHGFDVQASSRWQSSPTKNNHSSLTISYWFYRISAFHYIKEFEFKILILLFSKHKNILFLSRRQIFLVDGFLRS